MKAAYLILTALLLTGCSDTYRYPCQDPANKDKEECNRPACEIDKMCYDTLNGVSPKTVTIIEEQPAAVEAAEEVETKGE